MNAAKYARAKAVFLNVCSLPSVAWESALDRECAGDPSLRTDVETLLAHHQSESILDAPPHQPRIVQVAFGGATSEKWNEEQRQFLHQRIRVWILVVHLLIALVLFRAFSYLDSWSKLSTFSASGIIVGCIGISALSILTVLLRAPSFLWLRRIELMLLGLGTMVICCWSYGWFKNGGSVAVSISRNVDERLASLYWIISADRFTHFRLSPAMLGFPSANFFAVITSMYAVVIPQTTRRLIVIIIAMLLLAGATILAAAAANPDLRPFVLRNIASNYLLVLGGGGICSYIGLKFQALRRAVFDAKQVGQFADIALKLFKAFVETDATLAEINPLIVTGTVLFTPHSRSGFVSRDVEQYDSFGRLARTFTRREGGSEPVLISGIQVMEYDAFSSSWLGL